MAYYQSVCHIYQIKVTSANVFMIADTVFLPTVVQSKAVMLRQEFGHFEVDTMQSGKTRGDVLVTITERLSRQHIVRHVSGRNSHALT